MGKKALKAKRARPARSAEEVALRENIVRVAQAMSERGLSPGRSGNVSARFGKGMLITPSGLAYDVMTKSDIVHVGPSGAAEPGARKPSSEWQFHLAAYEARPDISAVVHTHSLHATALACAHLPIPAFHYMVAVAGGPDIPLVPYAIFGSEELARHVAGGVKERNACLLANHGQIALGNSLDAALELAAEVEVLAQQYVMVRLLGREHVLTGEEMARVLEKFQSYGANAQK